MDFNFVNLKVRRRSNLKKTNIVQLLLKKNVKASIKNKDGESILDITITNAHSTILNLLLDKLNDHEISALNIERTLIMCSIKGIYISFCFLDYFAHCLLEIKKLNSFIKKVTLLNNVHQVFYFYQQ